MGRGGQNVASANATNPDVEDTGLILPPIPSDDDRSNDPEVLYPSFLCLSLFYS